MRLVNVSMKSKSPRPIYFVAALPIAYSIGISLFWIVNGLNPLQSFSQSLGVNSIPDVFAALLLTFITTFVFFPLSICGLLKMLGADSLQLPLLAIAWASCYMLIVWGTLRPSWRLFGILSCLLLLNVAG